MNITLGKPIWKASLMPLRGLLSFPLTAFDARLELDLDAFADHLEAQIAAGPGAVFVACGTGEFGSLSLDELSAVARRAVDVAAGRLPVWLGAGGGAAGARACVRVAAERGADGVLLMPPYLVTGPPAGTLDYVRYATADAAVPTVVYHRGTAVFTPSAAVELLDVPSVVGLKDGYGDVELMSKIVTTVRTSGHDRAAGFGFLNGLPTAEMSARAYRAIGVELYSSAVHSFAPTIAHAFRDALLADQTSTVDRLLAEFYLPLVALRDTTPGFAVALVKAAAVLRGSKVGGVRPPLVDPTPAQVDQLAVLLEKGLALV
ncbi:5-dehydro-4-deoxyglucarate dehydratase [Fodinicola acaciae]|uniref:5-dehydro-4-deoxyglucarate dehydratase n=1 Tax=Fodinicola acaciae TaxID=2681555 RepID=UPI0013D830D9|nr:5-dehydro-4-deoxyglucarate dehydratase [Fodinicola acaciae]